jgi:tetratricopeptide (TPR) repeat protein
MTRELTVVSRQVGMSLAAVDQDFPDREGNVVPNEHLRRRREATPSPSGSGLPMTRAELAAAVNEYIWSTTGERRHLDVDTLARYERGRARWPGSVYRAGLRAVLGAERDADLGFRPTRRGRASRQTTSTKAKSKLPDVGRSGLLERLTRLESDYDSRPAGLLLVDSARLLSEAMAQDSGPERERLAGEAQAAVLLGKIVWDASARRDSTAPKRYFQQSAEAAARAGDRVVEASAWLRICYVALYSDKAPQDGLALARRTAEVAAKSSKVLAGLGLLHTAEALGMLGSAREAMRALADAENLLQAAALDDPAAPWLSPDTVDRMAGSVFVSLGDGRRAERRLQAALLLTPAGSKARAMVTANLALALIRQQRPEQAAVVLGEALDVVESSRGGGAITIAFQAGHELAPWRDVGEVADIRERLLSLGAS